MSKELRIFLFKYAKEMQATQEHILSSSNCDAVEHEAIYGFYEALEKLLCDETVKYKATLLQGLSALDTKSVFATITIGDTLDECKRQIARSKEYCRLVTIMNAFE